MQPRPLRVVDRRAAITDQRAGEAERARDLPGRIALADRGDGHVRAVRDRPLERLDILKRQRAVGANQGAVDVAHDELYHVVAAKFAR